MSEFAEKVPSSAELYEYQLKISGDGSQDILPNLRQVLRDVGLEELDLQMSPAREMVTLPWIGAVEAHRLVTQLRKFSVTIYWDQRHALKE